MGYPLRSNIFKLGTWEQREFARFPVQTAVLYSANDHREFAEAFRSFFSYLDRITGDEVVFFAILEPPEDWLQLAHATRWADRHFYGNKGQVHLRIEDDVLVREMARIFSVSWDELPVLIASPNLWLGEYCVVPTDVKYFESQFQVLIDLVQKWGRPNLGLIKNAFEEEFSIPTSIYTPRNQLRERLITSYQFYESAEAGDRTDFMRSLRRQVENSQKSIFEARKAFIISNRTDEGIDDDSLSVIDTVSEDAAGQLVVPATLAYRFMQRIKEPSFFPTIEVLDPESSILLETALRVGDFLEITAEQGISFIDQRRPRSVKDFRNRSQKLDFSAAASGAWKALEREINFSIIQAARLARGISAKLFNLT